MQPVCREGRYKNEKGRSADGNGKKQLQKGWNGEVTMQEEMEQQATYPQDVKDGREGASLAIATVTLSLPEGWRNCWQ